MSVKVVTPAWRPDPNNVRGRAGFHNAAEQRLPLLVPGLTPGERHRRAAKLARELPDAMTNLRTQLQRVGYFIQDVSGRFTEGFRRLYEATSPPKDSRSDAAARHQELLQIGNVPSSRLSPPAKRLEDALNRNTAAIIDEALNSEEAKRKRLRMWQKHLGGGRRRR